MRRSPPVLTVDTDVGNEPNSRNAHYEITQSPSVRVKKSMDSSRTSLHETLKGADAEKQQQQSQPEQPAACPPQPSIKLLFSLVSQRDAFTLLVPAIATSVIAGGVAPFMTHVIGQVFDAFARFPLSGATSADKSALRHDVGLAAVELIALAAGAIALGSITSALWIATGERNVMRLRRKVYQAVTAREMEWFDTKMGGDDAIVSKEGDGPVGAGGLMAKFTKDTDDVRMASSLASGMLMQYFTTCLTCLVLAFSRSWALTLVILSAVPILVFIQALSQRFAGPLVAVERSQTAVAATLVERAIAAITTVKAFNAQAYEVNALSSVLEKMQVATTRANTVWGTTSALSQFASMGMFVQGFWFGASLVRKGSVSPGDVMAVFWACLIATSNLQLCIPQLIILAKGKFAMAALIALAEPPSPPQRPASIRASSMALSATTSHLTLSPATPVKGLKPLVLPSKRPQDLRKIQPVRCAGEFSLANVSFAYPSRPDVPVLRDVSLFFPASETTFVVGGSGSGKSTVAQLLARLYTPDSGSIFLDDQDAVYIDERWLRTHVAVVSQTCILFDGTVHDNVAMGVAGLTRRPEEVTRAEVEKACTAALMHEFVRDLPQGYGTRLGSGGATLSGGQKQRLAIARAILRDPTVLVLDEATSALDATSRVLVFEAIKRWRANKTTIVITHDLSQITPNDFVYVLRDGFVVEQGYRADLEMPATIALNSHGLVEEEEDGEFRKMMRVQGEAGGFPMKEEAELSEVRVEVTEVGRILERAEVEAERSEWDEDLYSPEDSTVNYKRLTGAPAPWMLDVQDLARSRSVTPSLLPAPKTKHLSISATIATSSKRTSTLPSKRTSYDALAGKNGSARLSVGVKKRLSLQFTPTSPTPGSALAQVAARCPTPAIEDDDEFELEKTAMERTAEATRRRRARANTTERARWTDVNLDGVTVERPAESLEEKPKAKNPDNGSIFKLFREVYPTVPNKFLIFLGLIVCFLSGAMTPVFSFLLSRLLFEVSIGATHIQTINMFGGLVLAVAATDGLLMGLKYFIMETGAVRWVTSLRKACYTNILAQDKKFFDKTDNSAVRLVQVLIKDGADAQNLIAVVLGQFIVVSTMMSVGLIWALVVGWQLTLAGLAIGPVFAVTMSVQANLVARCERKNKLAREEIAKGYYECISNIRAIRCMSFEGVFKQQFDDSVSRAYSAGVRGAFIEGCSFGIANGLIYLAEALLFFIGAVLVANGTYTYLQMVQVLQLIVFTVTIGSQLMAFTQRIAKATQATRDFNNILSLSADTDESRGSARPPIEGDIEFYNVDFSYPERADVPILQKTSLRLQDSECVAIVGASGSGKSTVASLLQRLYEPTAGSLTIGSTELRYIDIAHLREHVSVVSQNPNLFDATIAENIAYGNPSLSADDIRAAAQAAQVHGFILSLPKGYDTMVGENAALISGGQAQRLAIARALARPSKILILDECTSALDPANQAAVMETIRSAKVGRTTLIITHKLPVMQMCDRIVVIHEGVVAEDGAYDELMRRNGVFSQLASGGEWAGE